MMQWTFRVVAAIGLLMAGFGAYFIVYGNEATAWPSVEGTVVATTVRTDYRLAPMNPSSPSGYRRTERPRFYPSVTYSWSVDGQTYTGSRYQLGTTMEKFLEREQAEAEAARFPPGRSLRVYYDPDDPSEAVLERSVSGGVYVPLPLGLLFLAAGLVGLKHLPQFERAMRAGAGAGRPASPGNEPLQPS